MSHPHTWRLVVPQRGAHKWHLWRGEQVTSVCNHADHQRQEIVAGLPRDRHSICQECRCYAQRNAVTLPLWAILPRRKRATT